MPGDLIVRFTIEVGDAVGEVSLFQLNPEDSYLRRSKVRHYVELSDLHVDMAARGRGWSKLLLNSALAYADAHDYIVFLRTVCYDAGHLSSAQLAEYYTRFGFRPTRYPGEMLRG